jgi:hypothetical protein
MATQPNLQKPPKWVTEAASYYIRSVAFGVFTARCVVAHVGWASFCLSDLSPQLEESGYQVGDTIEMSAALCSVKVLA